MVFLLEDLVSDDLSLLLNDGGGVNAGVGAKMGVGEFLGDLSDNSHCWGSAGGLDNSWGSSLDSDSWGGNRQLDKGNSKT